MKVLLGIILVLGVLVFLLRRFGSDSDYHKKEAGHSKTDKAASTAGNEGISTGQTGSAADCLKSGCGVTCFCDDITLKRAVKTEIEYFDDEELDDYRGIGADQYTEAQVEDFNEVLTTLKPSEVGDWMRSLELRNIVLPSALKDEALMLMDDGTAGTESQGTQTEAEGALSH